MKQFKNWLIGISLVSFLGLGMLIAPKAYAEEKTCGGVKVAILSCQTNSNSSDPVEKSALWAILTIVLNILVGGVSIAAVGGIVYGALMYTSAQDNASQVQEAIGIIRNVIIGLVMLLLMWAGLQYLIPGGIFNTSSSPQQQPTQTTANPTRVG